MARIRVFIVLALAVAAGGTFAYGTYQYMQNAPKGSVALDGVSLTVNEVDSDRFGVNIIPHTLSHTGFGEARPGQRMNIEIDPLARYVARLLGARPEIAEQFSR